MEDTRRCSSPSLALWHLSLMVFRQRTQLLSYVLESLHSFRSAMQACEQGTQSQFKVSAAWDILECNSPTEWDFGWSQSARVRTSSISQTSSEHMFISTRRLRMRPKL